MTYECDDDDLIEVRPTREGDDDLCPEPPTRGEYREIEAKRRAEQKLIDARMDARKMPSPERECAPDIIGSGSIAGFIKSAVIAIAILVVANILYGAVHAVVAAQTTAELWCAVALLGITLGVVGFISLRAWGLFAKLPRVNPVRESDFANDPRALREAIKANYLAPIIADKEMYLKRLGLTDEHKLAGLITDLATGEYADSANYISDFKRLQIEQETLATTVITKRATYIGIKTAACPWRVLDMVIVFYNSTSMICEIAGIYNRRVTKSQAFRLLLGWILNIYVSGELGDVMASAGEAVGAAVSAAVPSVAGLIGKFVGKSAEGGINAYIAYRLGHRAVSHFRYLAD